MPSEKYHVAIVGGGITGAMAASALIQNSEKVHVTLFDQGRSVGGRSSHRRIDPESKNQLKPEEEPAKGVHNFDHGCQFFRADDETFRAEVEKWVASGWASKWDGRFGVLPGDGTGDTTTPTDFFGLQKSAANVYVGVKGINSVVRGLLGAAAESGRCDLFPGVRVASMQRTDDGTWQMIGPEPGSTGTFHDTSEKAAAAAQYDLLVDGRKFNAVLVTDISASFESWHRASASVPEALSAQVRHRVRIPLFTALVVFAPPGLPPPIDLDGATIQGDSCLWFAARTASKNGLSASENTAPGEAWTLVSTPAYAAAEIERVPMRDPETGAFIPQDPSYLSQGPSSTLLAAFEAACRRYHAAAHEKKEEEENPGKKTEEKEKTDLVWPAVAYLGGQRWGSALPAPTHVGGRDGLGRSTSSSKEICGTWYETSANPPLFDAGKGAAGGGGGGGGGGAGICVAEEEQMVYAGDFCSQRNPGYEAAALSGREAAVKILQWAAAAT